MARKMAGAAVETRPLTPDDLDRVVAIDRVLSGRSRRGFYQTRLEAALREPRRFIYLGAEAEGGLAGFMFAHLLEGEFGGEAAVAVMDAVGVDPAFRGQGVAQRLMSALDDIMRHKGVRELQSQVDWTNHGLVRFLDAAGFALAPRYVLTRPVVANPGF